MKKFEQLLILLISLPFLSVTAMAVWEINCSSTADCAPFNAYCVTTEFMELMGIQPVCACYFELGHVMNTYAEPVIINGYALTGVCEDPSTTTVAGQTTTVAPLTYADSCLLFEVNCNSTTADLTLNTTCFNEIDRAFGTDLTGLNIAKSKEFDSSASIASNCVLNSTLNVPYADCFTSSGGSSVNYTGYVQHAATVDGATVFFSDVQEITCESVSLDGYTSSSSVTKDAMTISTVTTTGEIPFNTVFSFNVTGGDRLGEMMDVKVTHDSSDSFFVDLTDCTLNLDSASFTILTNKAITTTGTALHVSLVGTDALRFPRMTTSTSQIDKLDISCSISTRLS